LTSSGLIYGAPLGSEPGRSSVKIPKEGGEERGKLTGGVVPHDEDRILKDLGCVLWEVVSQR
jgi:hypothetical protein